MIGILASAALADAGVARGPDDRPNIILILADDMGYSDLGCFGSEIETPHIDALAASGLRFTQAYASPACCPARASLLSGLYPHQAGVGWMVSHGADTREPGPYQGYLNRRCVTLAEVLKGAGYQTFLSGKWHVGESPPNWPGARGFERSFSLISGGSNFFDLTKAIRPDIRRQMTVDDVPYDPPRTGFYMTDAIGDEAVKYLHRAAGSARPFFLFVSFTAPHSPLHAPASDIARHRGKYLQGWDVLRQERLQRMKAMGIVPSDLALSPRDERSPPWEKLAPEKKDLMDLKMAIYAAQVELMDTAIGRIIRALRAIGREDRTMILFLSDNGAAPAELSMRREERLNRAPNLGGPESYDSYGLSWAAVSNTPWKQFKGGTYEGGIAVPLIITWPGVVKNAGTLSHAPVHVIDFMATLVEAGRAAYPRRYGGQDILPVEGISLLPLLRHEDWRRGQPLFWEFAGHRAVRDGDWKLVAAEGADWELYDLENDRIESRDLAWRYPEKVATMAEIYRSWMKRCGVVPWDEVSGSLHNLGPAPRREAAAPGGTDPKQVHNP